MSSRREERVSGHLLAARRRVELADFGHAARVTGPCAGATGECGTAEYRAPEIVRAVRSGAAPVSALRCGVRSAPPCGRRGCPMHRTRQRRPPPPGQTTAARPCPASDLGVLVVGTRSARRFFLWTCLTSRRAGPRPRNVLYYITLYYITLYYNTQHLGLAMFYIITSHCIILRYITIRSTSASQCFILLHHIVLYYVILQYAAPRPRNVLYYITLYIILRYITIRSTSASCPRRASTAARSMSGARARSCTRWSSRIVMSQNVMQRNTRTSPTRRGTAGRRHHVLTCHS